MANEPEEKSAPAADGVPALAATTRWTGGQILSIVLLVLVHAVLVLPLCFGLVDIRYTDNYPFQIVYAQGYLLAAFLALGRQSPVVRWAVVALAAPLWWVSHMVVRAAYMELAWYATDPALDAISSTWGLVLLAIIALGLWICRWSFGFEWTTSSFGGRRPRTQFRLSQLLFGIAAAAVVCGIIRVAWPRSDWEPFRFEHIWLGFADFSVYSFGIALAIPSVLFAVGRYRWMWWWLAIPAYYVVIVTANILVDVVRWDAMAFLFALSFYATAYTTGFVILIGSVLWVRATFERPVVVTSHNPSHGGGGSWWAARARSQKAHTITLYGSLLACFVVLDLSFIVASSFWTPTQVLMAEGAVCGQCTLLAGWLVLGRASSWRRTVFGVLALGGLCATAIGLRWGFRLTESLDYEIDVRWAVAMNGVLFLFWFRGSEPGVWTCLWPAGVALAFAAPTFLVVRLLGASRGGGDAGRRHDGRLRRTKRLRKYVVWIAMIVAMGILFGLVTLGSDDSEIRYLDQWTWQPCALLVAQVFVHVLLAALVIASMGQRPPKLRSWVFLAGLILVFAGLATANELGLVFRVTTVIAAHLATISAGLAVAHAANRGRVFLPSVRT